MQVLFMIFFLLFLTSTYFCITPWTQDVNRMYRRCSRCLLKSLCTFALHPLSRSYVDYMHDIGGLFLLCLAWICGFFFAQLRDFLVLKLVVVSGTLSNILDGVKNSSKMNTFSWLFKTLRHIKYPLKIKNYVYFAQSRTQQFENNCFLSKLFVRLKW